MRSRACGTAESRALPKNGSRQTLRKSGYVRIQARSRRRKKPRRGAQRCCAPTRSEKQSADVTNAHSQEWLCHGTFSAAVKTHRFLCEGDFGRTLSLGVRRPAAVLRLRHTFNRKGGSKLPHSKT